MLSALDTIFIRRSIRAFTDKSIEEPTIRSLLDAAVQAPTALHEEPWVFVVIQDRDLLKTYSDRAKGTWTGAARDHADLHPSSGGSAGEAFAKRFANPDFCIFYNAGTLILICAKRVGPFAVSDCWLAAENLMLAACALGLGTCCIGSAIPALNLPESKRELGISEDIDIVVPIIVGVPKESPPPAQRREPVVVSWKKRNR